MSTENDDPAKREWEDRLLEEHEETVTANVTANIFRRLTELEAGASAAVDGIEAGHIKQDLADYLNLSDKQRKEYGLTCQK